MKPIRIYLLMTMAALFWGGAFVSAKFSVSEMTALYKEEIGAKE